MRLRAPAATIGTDVRTIFGVTAWASSSSAVAGAFAWRAAAGLAVAVTDSIPTDPTAKAPQARTEHAAAAPDSVK
jgi:hypothetical protein